VTYVIHKFVRLGAGACGFGVSQGDVRETDQERFRGRLVAVECRIDVLAAERIGQGSGIGSGHGSGGIVYFPADEPVLAEIARLV
jgi:hypothetical protein